MELYGFKIIDSFPALHHPDLDLLVIADIHLGLEGSMTRDGNYVPKHQLHELRDDIEELSELTEASRILVNGDLKNEFKTRYTETREIKEFLELLQEEFDEVITIQGNHDTFVEETVKEYSLEFKDYHLEKGILFTHGHIELDELGVNEEYETVVIGHEHPALALKDDVGVTEKIDCFVYGEQNGKKIIVLPSFSTISRGTNINETPVRELLSPVLKNGFDVKNLKAIGVSREAGLFEFPELGKIR